MSAVIVPPRLARALAADAANDNPIPLRRRLLSAVPFVLLMAAGLLALGLT